ncbi:hypothetical protein [Streptomyces sp. NPDC088707]|uniref:hypothetical protein n=1 Tax=Streptomyces sp. NPDC088707 TaxID=3365871 RepID=UPI00380D73E6
MGRGRRVADARAAPAGSHHWVFTDHAALVPQLAAVGLTTAAGRAAVVGAVDPRVSVPAVRKLVRSFFARRLPVPGAVPASVPVPGPGPGHAPRSAPPARWGWSPQ